ncbi:MAG: ATP-binding protein, partial [Cyanobacteria bacterium P01_F01_bin.13]
LSIVKNIIDKHSSQMHLVSEIGIGTTFWFDLTVYETQTAEPEAVAAKHVEQVEEEGEIAPVAAQATPKESA